MKEYRLIANGLILLLVAAGAYAQEEPAKEPAEEQAPEEEVVAPPVYSPSIQIGWTDWSTSGNRQRFLRYGTPPKGLYLSRLLWEPRFMDLRYTGGLDLNVPGEEDSYLAGSFTLDYGRTMIEGSAMDFSHFEPTPIPVEESERSIDQAFVRQAIGNGQDFSFAWRGRQDNQDRYYEPGVRDLRQRTRSNVANLGGSLWGGFLNLTYSDWQYYDRTNVLPDTNAKTWGFSYGRDLSQDISFEGAYSTSTIEQPGRPDSEVSAWSVSGIWQMSPNTKVDATFRREDIDLPIVENSYVRDRSLAQVRVGHRLKNGWSAQVGYRATDIERVRADQTFVDAPTYHTVDARLVGRLSPSVRVTLRGLRESLDGKFGMQTDDGRSLYWRNRTGVQLKFDIYDEPVTSYLIYSFNDKRNDGRDTNVTNRGLTIGTAAPLSEQLDVYAEFSSDRWTASSDDPESANLNQFFPDGEQWTLGANWILTQNTFATLNYTQFSSTNNNPLGLIDGNFKGRQLTASFRHVLPQGYELGLTLAPWSYRDKLVPQADYNSSLITFTARTKF